MKLYFLSDGPPSLSVVQAFKYIKIPFELINVNFGAGEHMTEEFARKNPQKEIPVLDDDGFFLGESHAILQYLCDKYKPDDSLYPKDPNTRAIVNHHLFFDVSTYYRYIFEYTMAPIYFAYESTPLGLKKLHIALDNFNTYLKRQETKYAAADHITIADLSLINSTMCLESVNFDFSKYDSICKWYSTFKKEYPDLWEISASGMEKIQSFAKNPPDLSHMDHPIHPTKRTK